MNKKLLCLGVALLTGVSAFAQNWDYPVPENYKFADEMKSTLQASQYWEGDTTFYYLYNVDGRGFLTNTTCSSHDRWDTHAAIKREVGNLIMMAQYRLNPIITNDTITEGDSTYVKENVDVIPWDGVTYKLLDYWNNQWKGVFANTPYTMFVDRDAQPNYMWNVKAQGNGVYRICVSDLNPNYNSHCADSLFGTTESYLGFDFGDGDYDASLENPTMPLTPMIGIDADKNAWVWFGEEKIEASAAIEWKFMPKDQYDLYHAHIDGWNYLASGKLDAFIVETQNAYPKVDIKALLDIQNSTEPITLAEIEEAIKVVNKARRVFDVITLCEGASLTEPNDITELIENPKFDGNANGWTLTYKSGVNGTNLGYQAASYSNGEVQISNFFEAWAAANYGNDPAGKRTLGTGKGYQLVEGLPAGMYKFTCDAIASRQDEANQGKEKGAYLYAQSGEYVFRKQIGTFNEKPEHFELTFVNPQANDFELGFMTDSTTINWLAVDNFTLTYFGEVTSDDPYLAVLLGNISSIEHKYAEIDDTPLNDSIKNELLTVIEDAKACANNVESVSEDYISMDSLLTVKANAVATSIKDYDRMLNYMAQVTEKQEAFEDSDFPGLGQELSDYYMELETAFDERTADAAYINQIPTIMGNIIVDYITANVKPGDELTPLIKNPNFDNDFSGWSNTGARPAFGGKGGNGDNSIGDVAKLESGNAEVFHNTFDMFQLIKNMPKGSFKLTCQAFERNDSKQDYDPFDPEANINAVLYANQYTVKVPNIRAFAQESMIYQKGSETGWPTDTRITNFFDEGQDGFVPNSMDGANFYFNLSPETYMCEINFTLAEAGDSITIGLKNTFNNSWVIFDNFRLFYNGDGVDAFTETFEKLTANLNALKDAGKPMYTGYAQDIETAIAKIADAPATESADSCIAAAEFAQTTIDNVKASVKNYEALDAAYSAFATNLEVYAETAAKPVIMQANKVNATAISTIEKLDADNETVEALIKKLNELTKSLARPSGMVIEDLTAADFFSWTAADATGEKKSNAGCAVDLNKSTGMPYGDGNVYYLNYADLSDYSEIIITYTAGTPRLLFNRTVDNGTVGYEYPRDNIDGWTTVVDNGDGSKTFTLDLTKLVERDGFAHLHAIKGANWVNTTVTSMQVNKAGAPEEIWIGDEENTCAWATEFSEAYTLHEGETAEISFINYTDEVNNYDNWVLVAYEEGKTPGAGVLGANDSYTALRSDAYGWGSAYDGANIKHDYNWDTFKSDMNGATVKITLYIENGQICMDSETKTIDGSKTYTMTYQTKPVSGLTSCDFFMTVEHGHLCNGKVEITGVPTAIETITTPATAKSAKYMENGKIVIVKNGKKYNVAGSLIK